MKGYRKPLGAYIEVPDGIPAGGHLTPVALRPSSGHVFAEGWDVNPLDAAVCWRVKTAQELDGEKATSADALFTQGHVLVVRATVDVLYPYLVSPPARTLVFAAIKARIKELL